MIPRFLAEYSSFDEVLLDLVRLGYTASTNRQAQGGQWEFIEADGDTPPFDELQISPRVGDYDGFVFAFFTPAAKPPWGLSANDGGVLAKLDPGITLEQLPDACRAWIERWEATPGEEVQP